MDYMPGGDFLGLLIRDNILSEAVTKWYIAEMILCIEEAHRLRWIHRDIKPDNFLISASGHLKISDFGLAFDGHWSHDQSFYNNHRYSLLTKLGIAVEGDAIDKKDGRSVQAAMKLAHVIMGGKDKHEKKSDGSEEEGILNWRNRTGNRTLARSVVGTSQYMAPEVVRGELYDARCDWWSVAVILYEVRSSLHQNIAITNASSVCTATLRSWPKKVVVLKPNSTSSTTARHSPSLPNLQFLVVARTSCVG